MESNADITDAVMTQELVDEFELAMADVAVPVRRQTSLEGIALQCGGHCNAIV